MKYLIAILADDEAVRDLLPEGLEADAGSIRAALMEEWDQDELEHIQLKVVLPDRAEACFDAIAADAAS